MLQQPVRELDSLRVGAPRRFAGGTFAEAAAWLAKQATAAGPARRGGRAARLSIGGDAFDARRSRPAPARPPSISVDPGARPTRDRPLALGARRLPPGLRRTPRGAAARRRRPLPAAAAARRVVARGLRTGRRDGDHGPPLPDRRHPGAGAVGPGRGNARGRRHHDPRARGLAPRNGSSLECQAPRFIHEPISRPAPRSSARPRPRRCLPCSGCGRPRGARPTPSSSAAAASSSGRTS